MTTAAVAPPKPAVAAPPPPTTAEPRILLRDVPWEVYEALLATGTRVRMNYDGGDLELWMPGWSHETWKTVLAGLFELLVLELGVRTVSAGSLTIREELKKKGCEPDECYFIQRVDEVLGIDEWVPGETPPPDLAIEAEDTSALVPRLPILAGLGVPEVWRFAGERVEALVLQPGGDYRMSDRSVALPFLRPEELSPFVHLRRDHDDLDVKRAFRRWVRERFADQLAEE